MIFVIEHSDFSIFESNEYTLHVLGPSHLKFAYVSDFCGHWFREIDSSLIIKRINISVHGSDDDGLVQFDHANWFWFDVDLETARQFSRFDLVGVSISTRDEYFVVDFEATSGRDKDRDSFELNSFGDAHPWLIQNMYLLVFSANHN